MLILIIITKKTYQSYLIIDNNLIHLRFRKRTVLPEQGQKSIWLMIYTESRNSWAALDATWPIPWLEFRWENISIKLSFANRFERILFVILWSAPRFGTLRKLSEKQYFYTVNKIIIQCNSIFLSGLVTEIRSFFFSKGLWAEEGIIVAILMLLLVNVKLVVKWYIPVIKLN